MVEISIECTTIGANIYYTTDGTTPDTSSIIYNGSFTINKTAWIQAIAIIGPMSSSVANGYFDIIIPVAEPVISPAEGTYFDSVAVSIACETEGALIYYTTDGYEPTTESTLYEGAFTLTESAWVSAIAVLDTVVSNLTTAFFTIEAKPIEVAKPVIQPEQTEFEGELQVSIDCATETATIYYTTDGTAPDNNSTIFTESFTIDQTTTIKAIAYVDNFSSEVAEKTYTLKEVAAPVEVATLAELRAGATDGTTYAFTGTATVTFAMDFRGQKYIQDETAAILIDDNNGIITENFEIGDGISGLKGSLSDYNGLLQFLPVTNAEKVNATVEIQAQTISIEEFKTNFEEYKSRLIKLLDITFTESGEFENGTNYSISNNGESSILRTHFYNMDYIGTAIPDKNVHITGIALWHYDEAKIVPRRASDIEEGTGINKSNIDVKIFSNGTQLFVQQINTTTDIVEIYRFDGRKLTTHRPNASFISIDIENNGLYTVLVKRNGLLVRTEKIQITH
ncbi:MAG: chitobiase/beta-hexosaminidase C-terminal domain-containing protein, partial [Prolixibacteraceae bacterium]|nr:chitobiase/beta-hexosaminidase C-terminal domain-containing protein [Prolixibacteraceae bacterium]